MKKMPVCPYCQSDNTCSIQTRTVLSEKEEMRLRYRDIKRGIKTYYVSPEEYKMYKKFGHTYYCLSCRKSFAGKAEDITDKRTINDHLKATKSLKPGKIHRKKRFLFW